MKTRYRQKRDAVIDAIRRSPLSDRAEILEQDAGLHFLMVLPTDLDDRSLRRWACGWPCCRITTASPPPRPSIY